MKKNFLQAYTIFDLVLIAMFTALTIAFKAIAGMLVRLITGPLGVPGGTLAGGLYMLWMPLGLCIINKKGVALLISLVQVVVLLITGAPGSHGIWSFFTYMAPALAVEIVFLFRFKGSVNILHFVLATMIANILGALGSNLLFFRLTWLPLLFTLAAAALSGAMGGVIGYVTYTKLKKTNLIKYIKNKELKEEQAERDKE